MLEMYFSKTIIRNSIRSVKIPLILLMAFALSTYQAKAEPNYLDKDVKLEDIRRLIRQSYDSPWSLEAENLQASIARLEGYLAWLDKNMDSSSQERLAVLYALSDFYGMRGDLKKAISMATQSLRITEEIVLAQRQDYGEQDSQPAIAISKTNLAKLYYKAGNNAKSIELNQHALVILDKADDDWKYTKHSLVNVKAYKAMTLNNLALAYAVAGRLDQAEVLLRRSISIMDKEAFCCLPWPLPCSRIICKVVPSRRHKYVLAGALQNLANSYANRGKLEESRLLNIRALTFWEELLGTNHPKLSISRIHLAILESIIGDREKVQRLARDGITAQIEFEYQQLQNISQEQRLVQQSSYRSNWVMAFNGAERFPGAAELALFSRLNRYGLLFEIEKRQALINRATNATKDIFTQISEITSLIADVRITADQKKNLEKRKQQLEEKLYSSIPTLRPNFVEPKTIADNLPDGASLIEFQKYNRLVLEKNKGVRWEDPSYMALVLDRDGSVRAIDLGSAASIDQLIAKSLKESQVIKLAYPSTLWAQVSRRIFPPPLLRVLAKSRYWILSPDSELNRIPYAALPSPYDPSSLLVDNVKLRLITSGRSLVIPPENPNGKLNRPIVLADPDFGPTQGGSFAWGSLPGTSKEGKTVANLINANLYEHADANTSRLTAAKNPVVIHIASHGYYGRPLTLARPTIAKALPNDMLRSSFAIPLQEQDDAMLGSAIVLAGANLHLATNNSNISFPIHINSGTADDGYLTAKEVAHLQLWGTELVVLSACDTASGMLKTGEGVYGLQRALNVAGARSTLLSLWKVDDDATAYFMERYYTLLKQGKGRMEALLAVQEEFRSRPLHPAWKDYRYWAAWQLVGDTGPIKEISDPWHIRYGWLGYFFYIGLVAVVLLCGLVMANILRKH